MKKSILVIFMVFAISSLKAQKANRAMYFLNKKEIAPQSVHFLNPKDIDSIRYYITPSVKADTMVVFYAKDEEQFFNYDQLLDYFFIEPDARKLKLNLPAYLNVEKPFDLVFSKDMVNSVSIYKNPPYPTNITVSSNRYHLKGDADVKSALLKLTRKFNNIK